MEILIKKINKQSVFVLLPFSAIAFFFADWRFAFSILIGGGAGLLNLRGLAWSLNALFGTERSGGKIVVLSIFRLLALFVILVTLAALRLINPFALLIGFTAVFTIILKEGLAAARKGQLKDAD